MTLSSTSLFAAAPSLDGKDVSLDEMLLFAEQHAPAVAVAQKRLQLGAAGVTGASPLFADNPEFSAGAGPRLSAGSISVDVEIGLEQRIDVAGERGLRLDAAQRRSQVFNRQLEQARWQVHGDVHAAFHLALVARAQAFVAADGEAFARDLLHIAATQVKAGEEAALTEKLAAAELARAQEQRLGADQRFTAACLTLADAAGWDDPTPPRPRGSLDVALATPPLQKLVELALAHDPSLRVRADEVEAARALVAAADRSAWPKPSLGIHYAIEGAAFGSGGDHVVVGTLGVPLPLWQSNQADRAQAQAELSVAEAEHVAARGRALRYLALAKTRVDGAAQRHALLTGSVVPTARENLALLRRTFELGDVDITSVMLGRERLLNAEREALDTWGAYSTALAELEAAIGADVFADTSHSPSSSASPIDSDRGSP